MSLERIVQLNELVARQNVEIQDKNAAIEQLQKENNILRQKVDALARRLFSSSSEKLDDAQGLLFGAPTQDNSPAPAPSTPMFDKPCSGSPKRHAGKPRLPARHANCPAPQTD